MKKDLSININKINDKIGRAKKRYYLVNYSNSLLKCLFLVAAIFVLFFTLTPFLFRYGAYRGALYTISVSALVFFVTKFFVIPIVRGKSVDFFALLLEKVTPGINNLIINSVQLGSLSSDHVEKYGLSRDLIDVTIEEASAKIDRASLKDAIDTRALKKNFVVVVAIAAALFMTYKYNPNFFKKTYLKFIYPELFLDDDPLITLEEVKKERLNIPEIGDFEITYKYPGYSNLPENVVSGGNGDIKCLKGTLATVSAKADRRLLGADFVFNESQKVTAVITNDVELTYEFLILEAGVYHLEFKGVDYPDGFEHKLYQVALEEDEYPLVRLIEPKEDYTVEQNDEIIIGYESSDDYGIGKINLVIEREKSTETINIFTPDGNVTEMSDRYKYSLSLLNLIPGEVLKVYVETYDNDTISGPKKSVSNERYFDVYSKEKRLEEIAQMKERLFEALIDLLGDHFEKSLVDVRLESTSSIADNQSRINIKTADIVALLQEILNAISEEKAGDDLSYIPLNNMRLSIRDLYDRKDALIKSILSDNYNPAYMDQDVASFSRLKEEEIIEIEEDIIYLDNEKKKAEMDKILEDAEDLLAAEKSLIDMLEELKDGGDMDDAKQKLEELIKQMEETFNEMMEKLSQFPQSLPDEFVNNESMQDMDMKRDKSDMDKLKEALKNNDIEEALKLANELLNSMNEMMSSFENSAAEFAQGETDDMMQDLDEAIEKLGELEEQQESLMKDTKEIDQAARERRSEATKNSISDFLKKQQQLINDIRRDVSAMQQELRRNPPPPSAKRDNMMQTPPSGVHASRRMPRMQQDKEYMKTMDINRMLNEMPRMMSRDFNQAEKLAEDILEKTKALQDDFEKLENLQRMRMPNSLERFNQKAESAQEKEKELLQGFKDLKKDSDNFLSQKEKESLKKMAKKQASLKKDLGSFQKGLEQKAGKKSNGDSPSGEKDGSGGNQPSKQQSEAAGKAGEGGKGGKGKGKSGEGPEGETPGESGQSGSQGQGSGGNNPALGDKGVHKSLDSAGSSMGKASGSMKQGKSSSSLPNQGNALSEMGKAKGRLMDIRQQMGEMQGQMPGSMPGGQMPGNQPNRSKNGSGRGRGINTDDVTIPSAEAYKVPKEFREDILKGMKEKSPKEYEKKVKKYYEELIR